VGTASEVYDYLRLLFAKIGEVFCPECHLKVSGDTVEGVVEQLLSTYEGVNPVRNSREPLNPTAITLKSTPTAEQRGIISNGVKILVLSPVSLEDGQEKSPR